MPYSGERATGDSLWRLEENPSVKAFKGTIQIRNREGRRAFLRPSSRPGDRTTSDESSPWTGRR